MNTQYQFYNREITWLSFNYRVLQEIKDTSLPLYERLKFLAIYSSNLDEFYKVRVAFNRNLLDIVNKNKSSLSYNPEKVLKTITKIVKSHQDEYKHLFFNQIIPELAQNNIILYQQEELNNEQITFAHEYFEHEVMPYLQPVLLMKDAMLSFLQDNVIYLVIRLIRKNSRTADNKKKKILHAILKIPTHHTSRFVVGPQLNGKQLLFFLDDIIRLNFDKIFPGYHVDGSYSLKLSRDADLLIEDEFSGSMIDKIKKSLLQRKTGAPCRFLYDESMPKDSLKLLFDIFKLEDRDLFPGIRYHNLADFFSFPNPHYPALCSKKIQPIPHPLLEGYDSIFSAIRERDVMLHFPYNSYNYVLRFLNEAAIDPKVQEIKITQYRVASDSAVVRSLITAAMNGKKVTVFVEIKARFDEEANIHFAELMKTSGVNVITGIPGLKVHAKAALVIRKSSRPSKQRAYAFISTGNFNEKTAQIYADDGLLTTNDKLIEELKKLFVYLEHPVDNIKFKNILVPKFNLTEEINRRIDIEIENAKAGRKAYILFKMNGLEEKNMIKKLYQASENNVQIDLIIRGICCLIPNKQYSQNIKITRLVDQYLEHSRTYIFYNGGNWDTFIGSADLMNRNLLRRIELVVPIYDADLKTELREILQIQLKDNVKARMLNENMENIIPVTKSTRKIRAQIDIYKYLKKRYTTLYKNNV